MTGKLVLCERLDIHVVLIPRRDSAQERTWQEVVWSNRLQVGEKA